jgi:hypothetical protein
MTEKGELQPDEPLSAKVERHRMVYLTTVSGIGGADTDQEAKARMIVIRHTPWDPDERDQKLLYVAGYSQTHIPTVPIVDYLPPKPVPATTPAYANAGKEQFEEAEAIKPAPEAKIEAKAEEIQAPVQKESPKEQTPSTSPARDVNRAAFASTKVSAGGSPDPTRAAASAPEKRTVPFSEDEIEKAHNDRVSRLKEVVDREAAGKSPRKRKSLEELFAATVPDPEVELGRP